MTKMAEKKFGKGKCKVSSSENGIAIEGDKDILDWALAEVKSQFMK